MNETPTSKVLILNDEPEQARLTQGFCEDNHLIALRVSQNNLMQVLQQNIDLGAILYSEKYGGSLEENVRIASEIRSARPELPIILCREAEANLNGIPESVRHVFCAAYTAKDMSVLRKLIDEYIFSAIYPNALVRGITEITDFMMSTQFPEMAITWDTPCLVRDRLIFGELFSLIELESSWCRGYMMIETEEAPFIQILDDRLGTKADFRTANSVLGELTALIWGAFKYRYVGDRMASSSAHRVQLPLIVNHKHKYISFGSEDPLLSFYFTLSNEETGRKIKFCMRFIFNFNWAPEDFMELTTKFVKAGELELF